MKRKKIETFFKEMDSAGMIMERKGNTIEIIAPVCGNGLLLSTKSFQLKTRNYLIMSDIKCLNVVTYSQNYITLNY